MPRSSAKKIWAFRLILVCGSTILGLVGAEIILRTFLPYKAFHGGSELTEFREGGKGISEMITIDDRLGYRPRLGSAQYSEYGTYYNAYPLEKRKGVSRVLFAGDSVTARGRIVAAFRELYGDQAYEYWNAGVEGYNTVQEVTYYKLFNHQIHPDHIVLEFHINDFETTPIAFLNRDGQPVVYAPNRSTREINGYLFQHVSLYRLYVGLTSPRDKTFPAIASEVREALKKFQELARPARFTVLIFPILLPYQQWDQRDQRAYEEIKRILADLNIRSFDLKPLADAAAQEGINLQESPGDTWHPSDSLAKYFAARLKRSNVLEGDGNSDDRPSENTQPTITAGREAARR